MKGHTLASLLVIILLISACGKITRNGKIVRDCTGTYLKLNNKDYLICNPAIASSFADGSQVQVKFQHVSDCPNDPNQVMCELYHHRYGFVQITKIK